MKTRTLLAAVLIVPLCAGVTNASAATKKKKKPPVKKPTCNLVKDGPGDATGNPTGSQSTPNDPNLDVIGGDIATNAATMTVSIKLAALDNSPTGSGNSSQVGRIYRFFFTVRGYATSLDVGFVPIIDPYTTALDSWPTGAFAQSIDTVNHVIRFSVPIASLPAAAQPKPNEKIVDLKITSWRGLGAKNTFGLVDTGAATQSYTSAWPSCMKVGV